jgi:predicted glycoside hydrolase/deacetylase ChbG (UPF0249 family)
MLIINADDFGLNATATDNIIQCIDQGMVSTIGAMMFMSDSQRASDIARERKIEIGLHLNLTQKYDASNLSRKLIAHFDKVSKFLKSSKYSFILYNPFIQDSFKYITQKQMEEFYRLYQKLPAHLNGHHHMHLASNLIFSDILDKGLIIRRNHTFTAGEKSIFNRMYRKICDRKVTKNFRTTDSFYDIQPITDENRLKQIFNMSKLENVELMVHPSDKIEYEYILSPKFKSMVNEISLSNFTNLFNSNSV